MSLHIELARTVEEHFAGRLKSPARQLQDALIVELDNGVTLTIRYAASDAYSLRWTWAEMEMGIDTAPVHHGLATFPNHLHDTTGLPLPDPLTQPDQTPGDNTVRVIAALLEDPVLGLRPQP